MSFQRLIIWSCLIGGWAAFLGWFCTEVPFHAWIDDGTWLSVILSIFMGALVSGAIGGGVSVAGGLANPQVPLLLRRFLIGLAGGLIGGFLGTLGGACVFGVLQHVRFLGFIGRIIGFMLIGVGIGVTEGLFEKNLRKIRNGLIGGVVGGFLAGVFFGPIDYIIGSAMSSRAATFVMLGLCVGLAIGLAQVILKQAWLTVEAGFRPGRQMILGQDVVTLGTSEKASLIFIAYGAKGVEPIHVKISKQPDGGYVLEDHQSRTGTQVNGLSITGPTPIRDGDAIQFGVNVVRFNERVKHGDANLPPPVVKEVPKPLPATAITAQPPPIKPAPVVAVQAAPAPRPVVAVTPAPKPAPPAPKPVAAAQPVEGRCPICDKAIVGIPGERKCRKCFTTF